MNTIVNEAKRDGIEENGIKVETDEKMIRQLDKELDKIANYYDALGGKKKRVFIIILKRWIDVIESKIEKRGVV